MRKYTAATLSSISARGASQCPRAAISTSLLPQASGGHKDWAHTIEDVKNEAVDGIKHTVQAVSSKAQHVLSDTKDAVDKGTDIASEKNKGTLDDAVNKAANMAGRARECEGQPTAQPEQPGLKKEVDKPGPMINDTDPDKLGPDSPKNIRNENPY